MSGENSMDCRVGRLGPQSGFMLIELLFVVLLIGILVAVVGVVYWDKQRPTIDLKKEDWECVKSDLRTHLLPMQVGKTTIMQAITSPVCVEYRRRER